tara:strand:+ start:144 stop:815 length:672 start_codon:yes stop_codon:yes gene_type:complete
MLQHPQLSDCEVVFDGKAFYGVHAGCTWLGGEDGPTITFTERAENADDAIAQLCDACEPQSPPRIVTSKQAVAICEQPLPESQSNGAISATLVRAPQGKKDRDRVEAHLRGVGLRNLGQTMCMPLLTEAQRERSLNVVRGLKRLGNVKNDPIKFVHLPEPPALVVTDDRGLARRCSTRAEPCAVLTSAQLAVWLARYLPDDYDDDDEYDESDSGVEEDVASAA